MARSAVTFGVSTERGAVQAVALLGGRDSLPERILHHRTQQIRGTGTHDLARAVETALEDLDAEIGADYEPTGAAVTYRDATERRAIVTGLASGPWRTASLVSAKSAHLALARAMTWVDDCDHLVICEVVPGYQGFSLISPERDRVMAGLTTAGGTITRETMRPAITAAWDQFEAAGIRPDAVVLIGSAAGDSAVTSALGSGFGASVVPCKVAAAGAAIGAALVAQPEDAGAAAPVTRGRVSRGTTAVFAAASVLAGGLVVGGVYQVSGKSRTEAAPALTDARIAAQSHRTFALADPRSAFEDRDQRSASPAAPEPDEAETPTDVVTVDPATFGWAGGDRLALWQSDSDTVDSVDADASESDTAEAVPAGSAQSLLRRSDAEPGAGPSSMIPAPTVRVGAPDGALLFPGEKAPPQFGTHEFGRWWDNHWRMMAQWAAEMLPRA
ncbi:hypothetical protein [Nocardia blacklockiae]|uniref:hypothetical protein n=1 Tax=Nocardia blacklockiae TaxID=480036 RepID=UPI001895B79B|nr:hypothetical protein [Nocardia blacklockiae]MBF6171969.1 hypothetical protein [Nocardia blacklockiae]